jgi:ferritin-like metal-binding protein YciE
MPALNTAYDILTTELAAIHSAEQQLLRAMPKLSKQVSSGRLRKLLERRAEQGERLLEDVDEALEQLEAPRSRPKNVAAEGLIEDVKNHLDMVKEDNLVHSVLLASVQKIEHYCIAAWGTAASMGRLLGEDKVVETMDELLEEGKEFDEEMTRLAEEEVNLAALGQSEENGEDAGQSVEGESRGMKKGAKGKKRK